MAKTITSANAILLLSIPTLFDVPTQLQNFAMDDIFDTDGIQMTEAQMGVDGILSAGLVNNPVLQNISLMASSESGSLFDDWATIMKSNQEVLYAVGSVTLTSIGRKYALNKGTLTTYIPIPHAAKTLQPRRFTVTWESVIAQNI